MGNWGVYRLEMEIFCKGLHWWVLFTERRFVEKYVGNFFGIEGFGGGFTRVFGCGKRRSLFLKSVS